MRLRRCKQNLLTLQATCSFVFDYSTRRLLDLLSKGTPAGGIPLGGTLTFQFCTLALGNSQVGELANSDLRLHTESHLSGDCGEIAASAPWVCARSARAIICRRHHLG